MQWTEKGYMFHGLYPLSNNIILDLLKIFAFADIENTYIVLSYIKNI